MALIVKVSHFVSGSDREAWRGCKARRARWGALQKHTSAAG